MMRVVKKRPRAEQDLLHHFVYLGERNPEAAEHFLDAAEAAFHLVARTPRMGPAWDSPSPRLAGLRSWTIREFPNYRICYRPIRSGIEVLPVFHARQDIARLLAKREGDQDEQHG